MYEMSTKNALPDKPSQLLRLGLSDLARAENTPGYKIDMGEWHNPTGSACLVCLAGSVMAFTLESRPDDYLTPTSAAAEAFGGHEGSPLPEESRVAAQKLRALNALRTGRVSYALDILDIDSDAVFPYVRVRDYHDDAAGFKEDMEAIASSLEAAGL